VNDIMPVGLVALCIYGGMVASDFALYGIGAGARRLPWLSRLAVDDRVRNFTDMLKRNLFEIVALCRVVPGVVFVAFVACGWRRVPLARFTVASLVVSALYLPLMLCIVIFFGDTLDGRVGWWAWPLLLCVLVAIGFVRRQVFNFQQEPKPADGTRPIHVPLRKVGKVAPRDRIPLGLFYLPLIASWIRFASRYRSLTLPTVANPCDPMRGMSGESKSGYLLDVAANERRRIADCVMVARRAGPRTLFAGLERVRQSLSGGGLAFPLIAKPDVGHNRLCRIDDALALREYLRHFPAGEKLILQRFLPDSGEAAVLYARLPGAQSGRILSLTFRPGEHWRDASRHALRDLEARLTPLARAIPDFNSARSHWRFVWTEEFMRGKNFLVTEINGIRGGTSRDCDPPLPLAEVYRRLADQQRI